MPWSRCIPILLLIGTLSACSPDTPEAKMADYLERIAYTLEISLEDEAPPYAALMRFPERRDRHRPTQELRSGLLEALDLRHCQLMDLIAERNSSLGRVMQPSTILGYELRFFANLHPCYLADQRRPLLDEQFSQRLALIHRVKQDNLAAVIWNGLFTDEAMERNFSLSRPPLPLQGHPGFGSSLRALQQLSQYPALVQGFKRSGHFSLPTSLPQLETTLFTLYSNEYGSQLITSLALSTHYLNRTATTINAALQRRPLCFSGRPTEQSRHLRNVLTNIYAPQIQPYIATISRQGDAWLIALNHLLDLSAPLPPTMLEYRRRMLSQNPGSLWDDFELAIQAHTAAWQKLLTQCGLMPGQPTDQRPARRPT